MKKVVFISVGLTIFYSTVEALLSYAISSSGLTVSKKFESYRLFFGYSSKNAQSNVADMLEFYEFSLKIVKKSEACNFGSMD